MGNASGCNNLGRAYENGYGVKKSISQAKHYYGFACDLKLKEGCENYGRLTR